MEPLDQFHRGEADQVIRTTRAPGGTTIPINKSKDQLLFAALEKIEQKRWNKGSITNHRIQPSLTLSGQKQHHPRTKNPILWPLYFSLGIIHQNTFCLLQTALQASAGTPLARHRTCTIYDFEGEGRGGEGTWEVGAAAQIDWERERGVGLSSVRRENIIKRERCELASRIFFAGLPQHSHILSPRRDQPTPLWPLKLTC